VVFSNILAVTNKGAINQIFNIGSGVETSVEDLAHIILKIVGSNQMQYIPNEQDKPKKFVYDISKAKNTLKGYYLTKEGKDFLLNLADFVFKRNF
jgi:UDP-glucose 4-epimerase